RRGHCGLRQSCRLGNSKCDCVWFRVQMRSNKTGGTRLKCEDDWIDDLDCDRAVTGVACFDCKLIGLCLGRILGQVIPNTAARRRFALESDSQLAYVRPGNDYWIDSFVGRALRAA